MEVKFLSSPLWLNDRQVMLHSKHQLRTLIGGFCSIGAHWKRRSQSSLGRGRTWLHCRKLLVIAFSAIDRKARPTLSAREVKHCGSHAVACFHRIQQCFLTSESLRECALPFPSCRKETSHPPIREPRKDIPALIHSPLISSNNVPCCTQSHSVHPYHQDSSEIP